MKSPLALLALMVVALFTGCETTSPTTSGVHTPAAGSPERKAIVDATKAALAKQGKPGVMVQVPYLKVHNGWAWIQVNPRSADGSQNYESQSGLLREKAKAWTLLEWMPSEEGTDTKAYFTKLKAKYPSAPADIFPQ